MKQSILILASILITFSGFGQTEITKDSLSNNQKKAESVVIRCGSSITNYKGPLYIIDGVPFSHSDSTNIWRVGRFRELDPNNIVSIEVLQGLDAVALFGSQGKNGVVLITTQDGRATQTVIPKNYAFKVYQIPNENWTTQQEMYNAISAKVPSVQIEQATNNSTPNISMRGDDTTIVIVDGVRYDASILNTLNPQNIESVKVSNFPGAQNFFINQ